MQTELKPRHLAISVYQLGVLIHHVSRPSIRTWSLCIDISFTGYRKSSSHLTIVQVFKSFKIIQHSAVRNVAHYCSDCVWCTRPVWLTSLPQDEKYYAD